MVERVVIPRCIGCGAMYELERCEGGCRQERLELVAAGDLQALQAAGELATARVQGALPVLRELTDRESVDDWQQAYTTLSGHARELLHDAWAGAEPIGAETTLAAAPRIEVWRCPDCGSVDAPQECLGICIWRRFEWVRAAELDRRQPRVEDAIKLERRVHGLLGRIAFATPREGAWERSWRALSSQARESLALLEHLQAGQLDV